MPPTIHIVRHAQGLHNLGPAYLHIRDPDLTEVGEKQCATLRSKFPHHDKLTKLVASPLRRTISTCIQVFGNESLKPVLALDLLQEISKENCNKGSENEDLEKEFGDGVNLDRVRAEWWNKSQDSLFYPSWDRLAERGTAARKALWEIATGDGESDVHIAAVTHGGFVHFLTEDWHGIPGHDTGAGWRNCECRSYQFKARTENDEEYTMEETEESWLGRRGTKQRLTQTEQRELRLVVQKHVEPMLQAMCEK